MNPAALAKHLEYLEKKKADLQSKRKSQYVSMQVKTDLDQKMRIALDQRDELVVDNERLQIRSVFQSRNRSHPGVVFLVVLSLLTDP